MDTKQVKALNVIVKNLSSAGVDLTDELTKEDVQTVGYQLDDGDGKDDLLDALDEAVESLQKYGEASLSDTKKTVTLQFETKDDQAFELEFNFKNDEVTISILEEEIDEEDESDEDEDANFDDDSDESDEEESDEDEDDDSDESDEDEDDDSDESDEDEDDDSNFDDEDDEPVQSKPSKPTPQAKPKVSNEIVTLIAMRDEMQQRLDALNVAIKALS